MPRTSSSPTNDLTSMIYQLFPLAASFMNSITKSSKFNLTRKIVSGLGEDFEECLNKSRLQLPCSDDIENMVDYQGMNGDSEHASFFHF